MTYQALFGTNRKFLMAVAAVVLLSACTQTKIVDSWQTDQAVTKKPEKVAVIVVLPDGLSRKAVEIDIVKIMRAKGTPAVAASNLPGMSGGIRGEIDTDAATEMLKSAGADGVVVLFYSGDWPDIVALACSAAPGYHASLTP
jgi:hypothetical protein